MEFFKNCFSVACFLAAFGMTVWWCYRYSKDEDLCLVDFKSIESSNDLEELMFSFCLLEPVLELKLKAYNLSFNAHDYPKFLTGAKIFDGMEKVDYDYVTVHLSTYFYSQVIYARYYNQDVGPTTEWQSQFQVTYSGYYYDYLMKCFGLKLKTKEIGSGFYWFYSYIYPYSVRPEFGFPFAPLVFVHLPNQILLAGNTVKGTWPKRKDKLAAVMKFTLTNIDVLKRRNKKTQNCIEDNGFKFCWHFTFSNLGYLYSLLNGVWQQHRHLEGHQVSLSLSHSADHQIIWNRMNRLIS